MKVNDKLNTVVLTEKEIDFIKICMKTAIQTLSKYNNIFGDLSIAKIYEQEISKKLNKKVK